jgi:putative peptidoglycan lipid II flippase
MPGLAGGVRWGVRVVTAPPSEPVARRRRRAGGSALVGAGILLSRLTGLVRERAVGHFFGTGAAADAFTAAHRIPNVLQSLLGEGVLSASMIPTYSRLLAQGREGDAGRVAGAVAGLLAAVVASLVLVMVAFARPVTAVLAPGLGEDTFELTVTLMRIIAPAIGILVLSAWCLGVLNSHRRFFLSYVAPVLMNVAQVAVLVAAASVLAGNLSGDLSDTAQSSLVVWLAWGTLIGGALQFAVQVPAVLKVASGLRFGLRTRDAGTREVVRSFVPIVGARGVVHLSGFLHLVLASFLALGALAAMRYAQMLYVLPVSLFGMAVAAAELPELSTISVGREDLLRARVRSGQARIVFFVAPTMVAYAVVGDFLVAALYQSGEFDRSDVTQVWIILAVHALGLLATTGSRLLQSVLYGLGRPRTAARIALVRVGVSLALGAVLMFQFDRLAIGPDGLEQVGELPALAPLPEQYRDPTGVQDRYHLGAVGLAAAATVASLIEYRMLRRAVRPHAADLTMIGGRLRLTLAAAATSGVAAIAVRPIAAGLPPVVAGLVVASVVGVVHVVAAWRLGVPEARRIVQLVSRRPRTGPDPRP